MNVILASRSPRRLALLQSAGLAVEVLPVGIDETPLPGETVEATVARLSRAKAEACSTDGSTPIIAADTLVAVDDLTLGQPADMNQARGMLQQLSGRDHRVLTSVSVRLKEKQASKTVTPESDID